MMIMAAEKSTKITMPDFAYPQTVEKEACADLAKAERDRDGVAMVNALIRMGLAQTSIAPDSIVPYISLVEKYRLKDKRPVVKSVLGVLEARCLRSYLDMVGSEVDSRTSQTDVADDLTLWSGDQIRRRINQLVDDASADTEALKACGIEEWKGVVEADSVTRIFFPTMLDFVIDQGINRCMTYQMGSEKAELIDRWIAAHPEPSAPRVEALIQKSSLTDVFTDGYELNGDELDNGLRLYLENRITPYAVEFLLLNPQRDYYQYLKEFEETYPDYVRIGAVKNAISDLTIPQVSIKCNRVIAKDRTLSIEVEYENATSINLKVYYVSDDVKDIYDKYYKDNLDDKRDLVDVIPVEVAAAIPYYGRKSAVEFVPRKYGRYAIMAEVDGKIANSYTRGYTLVICSDLALICSRAHAQVYVVDSYTGAAVEGASMELASNENNIRFNGLSDKQGKFVFPKARANDDKSWRSRSMHPVKGQDRYSPNISVNWNEMPAEVKPGVCVEGKTDLSIYHPGDTVRFVGIAYLSGRSYMEPIVGKKIDMVLYDVNRQPLDTISRVSDDYGRVTGWFALPKSGITGYYMVKFNPEENNDWQVNYSTVRFMVSDYKLPTFSVTMDSLSIDKGMLRVSGVAETYSGFPVANARVSLKLSSEAPGRYFYSPQQSDEIKTVELMTDANGRFIYECQSEELLRDNPNPRGVLIAEATVTSKSDETRSGSKCFALTKDNILRCEKSISNIDASEQWTLPAGVVDPLGKSIDGTVDFKFISGNDTISLEAPSIGGKVKLNLDTVASGTYRLVMESKSAANSLDYKVCVYRPTDKASPSDDMLWVAKQMMSCKVGEQLPSILMAEKVDDLNVLAIWSAGDSIVSEQWLPKGAGMRRLEIPQVSSACELYLTMFAVYHGDTYTEKCRVVIEDPCDQLEVEIATMRDYAVPGSEETLTIKICDGNGRARSGAAILDIYNKSLDAILSSDMGLNFVYIPHGGSVYLSSNIIGSYNVTFRGDWLKRSPVTNIHNPELWLYNMSFGRRMYLMSKMTSNGIRIRGRSAVTLEDEAEEDAVMYEVKGSMLSGGEDLSVANEQEFDAGSTANGMNSETTPLSSAEVDFRDVEVPLACFEPMLTIGDDGVAEVALTWPNANATWVINAMAYDRRLVSAFDRKEITASKPVMVSANPPRFLRKGDKCRVVAMVMNKRNDQTTVEVTMELLDPLSMKPVVAAVTDTLTLPAMGSATVSCMVDADPMTDGLLLRVMARNGRFTDAEQHLIPLLEASQNVIESELFYMSPDQAEYKMELPGAGNDDDRTTVSFTANPVWEVMTALPGIRQSKPWSSPMAAANLFSLAVAKGIISDNPQVCQSVKLWLDSHADNEAMLSKFNQKPELKQLLLDATLWVEAAADDAQRMSRLALLLDQPATVQAYEDALAELEKFHDAATGGYRWGNFCDRTSEWATSQVLFMYARLAQLGFYDLDSSAMNLGQSMRYLDEALQEDVKKDKDYYDVSFAMLCKMIPAYKPSKVAADANRRAVNYCRDKWKKMSLTSKAGAAILINEYGYKSEAEKVLESLDQYSTYSAERGRCWQSLESGASWTQAPVANTAAILLAYASVAPDRAEIDQIRQWLVLNKISQGWGVSSLASDVVAAILLTGNDWLMLPEGLRIAVDGKDVELNEIDRLSGSVLSSVDDASGELAVVRKEGVPAWGAVITQSRRPMESVEARGCADLSIEKQMLVKRGDGWVEAADMMVGDIVKVRVIIKAKRRLDYVTVVDNRAAALEPVIQTPRYVRSGSVAFYLENRDASTNLFVDLLPKGTYIFEYEMKVNNAGEFASGLATIQSQYAPEFTAHSSGNLIRVDEDK